MATLLLTAVVVLAAVALVDYRPPPIIVAIYCVLRVGDWAVRRLVRRRARTPSSGREDEPDTDRVHMTALVLTAIALVAAGALFDSPLPEFMIILIYLVLGVLVWATRRWARGREPSDCARRDDERDLDRAPWPISGPIGRFGPYGLITVFGATQWLCLLNPLQVVESVRQVVGNATLARRLKRSGDDGRGYETRVVYTLPFDGEWLVVNGGSTPETSHSWDVLGQRFALDFVQADEGFRTHQGPGTRAEDYFCFGCEIRAAACGIVVRVEDRVRQAFLGWGVCDFTARSFLGNHVAVAHAEGEVGLYAHLVPGSVCVAPGDRVSRSQVLGRCGHTGHSTEPHLHFHLQDSSDVFRGMGLPVRFSHLVVDGEAADGVLLSVGHRVRAREWGNRKVSAEVGLGRLG